MTKTIDKMKTICKGETALHDGILINPNELELLKIGKEYIKMHLEKDNVSQMEKELKQ